MINSIKNKYFQYTPNEFLPIYVDGRVSNLREFHLYKAKKAAGHVGHALAARIDRAFEAHQ